MASWKETSASVRRFLGRRPLLALGASVAVLGLGVRALAQVSAPPPSFVETPEATPASPPACPPRSLSDAGVCVPAPHPETALALAESPTEEAAHDSLTNKSDVAPTSSAAPGEPAPASTASKFELEPVDPSEEEEPRRALRENPPEFERGTPEEPLEEAPEQE